MPFLLPRSLVCTAPSTQGHIEAAATIGCIYYWGQGVAVDYVRALAAYKIGAEGGNAYCQHQLGCMLQYGQGVDSPDYEQALMWLEKAAAQGLPPAYNQLGTMAHEALGQERSFRRAREHYQRAIDLGSEMAAKNMQNLTDDIQKVTRSHANDCTLAWPPPPPPPPPSSPPSWTSGSRSTAPPAPT